MQVDCVEGFDGGLPQGFLLELVEMPALRLVRNLSLLVSGCAVCGRTEEIHVCHINDTYTDTTHFNAQKYIYLLILGKFY